MIIFFIVYIKYGMSETDTFEEIIQSQIVSY